MPPKTMFAVVAEQFPDLTKDEVRKLVIDALNWLTQVGVSAANRIDKLCVNGEITKEALIERRAQAIAFGVLAKTIAVKYSDEEEQISVVTEVMAAISGDVNGA